MATDVSTDVVGLRKNAAEVLRVQRTVFNDMELLDVRVYLTRATGEEIPTRKGLSLRPELWRELLPLIERALAEISDNETATTD